MKWNIAIIFRICPQSAGVAERDANIGEQIGVDQSTILRFASKDENRQLIEVEKERLISGSTS